METLQYSALASSLHLLALAIGLPSIFLRAQALTRPLDESRIKRLLAADSAWGLAALLWISTGVWRAFGGLEKGSEFYLDSRLFWLKMGLLGAILLLEIRPVMIFTGWRRERTRGNTLDTSPQRGLLRLSQIQLGLVVAMVFVASFMARGYGQP